MKTTFALLLVVGILAGCQTATQQRASHISTVVKQNTAQVKACVGDAYNSPQAAAIRLRRPIDPADASLEQLNSKDYVSAEEVKALYALHDQIQRCRKASLENLVTVVPTIVPIMSAGYQEGDTALLALINKQMTWGQYLQDQQHAENDIKARMIAEWNRLQGEMQQSYQAEMQRRQAAAQAMANYLQNQQMINAINKPTYTNCSSFGNTTNCTTR
jgi:hypothetical protein